VLITPPLEHVGMLEWRDWQLAVDAGYQETLRVLEEEQNGPHPAGQAAQIRLEG
jgi:hypothetical protein